MVMTGRSAADVQYKLLLFGRLKTVNNGATRDYTPTRAKIMGRLAYIPAASPL